MSADHETTAKGAIALEEDKPPKSQYLKKRVYSNSPPWNQLLVYDCSQRNLSVQSAKNINLDHSQKVDLPPKRNQVTIFVDAETESTPTIASKGADGQSNAVLVTLYLDRLGAYHRVLRFLGLLSTLYVI
ncbi:MAG: hypothetical protein Q9175_003525 [Cornicularia normoerica]